MKKSKTIIFLIPAIILVIAGVCYFVFLNKLPEMSVLSTSKLESSESLVYQRVDEDNLMNIKLNYNWRIFNFAISAYPKIEGNSVGKSSSIIVPHHDLAGKYIAEIMQKISDDKIKTIIIVGPNHSEGGVGDIISGNARWISDFGNTETEVAKVSILKDKMSLTLNEDLLKNEHSINALVPYVHYYFPGARVVPIVLKHGTTDEEVKKLVSAIENITDDKTLIIGSIDFSHYLSTEESREKDKITSDILLSRDYGKIYSLNNDYIDSPATAAVVLKLTDMLGVKNMSIIRNANQADVVGLRSVESSTSYFTILFEKD